MLNRRVLRTKVLQALYAFFQSEDDRIDIAEKNLITSINKMYDLYIYQLSIIPALVEFIKQRQDENKLKHLPTEEDLNPNTKFADNRILKQITGNITYKLKFNELKISWKEEQDMLRQLYNEIKESNTYIKYARSFDNYPYEADKKFFLKIFRNFIIENETIVNYFEDKYIHWADDFYEVAFMVVLTIENLKAEHTEDYPLPELFKPEDEYSNSSDKDFITQLFRKTIIHSKKFEKLISAKTDNWDIDRIAIIDMILLKMAITEMTEFPSIPVKVTMNEYIDISKDYSTEKSKLFINGILDKLAQDLNKKNKLNKIVTSLEDDQSNVVNE